MPAARGQAKRKLIDGAQPGGDDSRARKRPVLVDLSNLATKQGLVVLEGGLIRVRLEQKQKRLASPGCSPDRSETASLAAPTSEPSLSAFLQDELESTAESPAPRPAGQPPAQAGPGAAFSFWPQQERVLMCAA